MGFKFSLILNREVNDDESILLKEAGCGVAVFGTDSLPTNADVIVTKMDFDDTVSPSLAEAIESALEAVKQVPDLSVPGLTVPAQPAERTAEITAEVIAEEPSAVAGEGQHTAEQGAQEQGTQEQGAQEQGAKKATARKPRTRKVTAKKEPMEAAVQSG